MPGEREGDGWNRREFLKALGASIGLPFFPSLFPRSAWADGGTSPDGVTPPRRLMFMAVPLGFVPNEPSTALGFGDAAIGWLPHDDGADYQLPSVHADLQPYRQHFSFLKGLSNRKYRGDPHMGDDALLTCADTLADPSQARSNTISCDQVAANSEVMGGMDVRNRSLVLGVDIAPYGSLSWTSRGSAISPLTSPARVFDRLFGTEDLPAAARLSRLKQKRSVLDATLHQIRDLNLKLNPADRRKLAEVTESVRGVEASIQVEEKWIDVPKPKASLSRPDESIKHISFRHAQSMFDLAHAAFLTDSTRVITYVMPSYFDEISHCNKHELTHPGGDPKRIEESLSTDKAMSAQVARFIKSMCDSKGHDDRPLLYHTLAAYGAGVWGASHGLRNLPMMLIGHGGGGIKQGSSRQYDDPTPMANLWLTMLKACGVPVDAFGDSTGTLDDLMG
jgi:hypothetical protein